jgi:sugar phosphate isomerase/epimerase
VPREFLLRATTGSKVVKPTETVKDIGATRVGVSGTETSPAADQSYRIGNQTSFAAAWPLEPFEFAVANGFTAFEFFPDRGFSGQGGWDERELDTPTRRYIRQTALGKDIALSVHAPLEFNPLRDSEDDRLYSSVEFAAEIGARLFNLHLDLSQGLERFVHALGPAQFVTAETGLQLTLENTVFTAPDDFNLFFKALNDAPDRPVAHIGMCLDVGHANLFAGTRNDYLRFMDQLTDQVPIRHLHLHENYGDRDSHLTLFTGPARENRHGVIGLLDRLGRRHFQGCAILEQWPQPPSLLVEARDRVLELLKNGTGLRPRKDS